MPSTQELVQKIRKTTRMNCALDNILHTFEEHCRERDRTLTEYQAAVEACLQCLDDKESKGESAADRLSTIKQVLYALHTGNLKSLFTADSAADEQTLKAKRVVSSDEFVIS